MRIILGALLVAVSSAVVMAQDMEHAMPGTVAETPTGKAIDVPRGLSAGLAAIAGLDKRLQAVEAHR